MSFLTEQTRDRVNASLHYAEYVALVGALPAAYQDKFVCLKPNCLDKDREGEARKFLVLQSVIRQIQIAVLGGATLAEAADGIADYCTCELPACGCASQEELTSGSGN